MQLPINFPDEGDVIYEDSLRFRALTPEEKVQAIGQCYLDYMSLRGLSGRAEQMDRFAEEQKQLERQAITAFVERHHG